MSKTTGVDSLLEGSMPKPYSNDLRTRVIDAVAAGASRREAAKCYVIDGSTGSFVVVTITPTVTGVVASVTTGEVTTGHPLTIKLDTSEAVNVTGSPVLLLNDGATASYDPAHSTAKSLAFDHTVASG
jgi:hypothetical protein